MTPHTLWRIVERTWHFELASLVGILMLGILPSQAIEYSDPFAEPSPGEQVQQMPPEPDHLVPIDPDPADWRVRYIRMLTQKLKSEGFCFAKMVRRPSFDGESSLMLHGKTEDRDINTTKEFFLTCSVAAKSIWYSMPENNQEKKQTEVNVTTRTASISKELALRVCAIWDKMIQRVQKPDVYYGGFDGEIIEFSTPKGSGEIWTPMQPKSPRMLLELGQSLADYCGTVPAERESKLEEIGKKTAALEKYLKEHSP